MVRESIRMVLMVLLTPYILFVLALQGFFLLIDLIERDDECFRGHVDDMKGFLGMYRWNPGAWMKERKG